MIKRKTEEDIVEAIVQHYKAGVYKPTLHDMFDGWIQTKYEYGELKKQSVTRYTDNFLEFFEPVTTHQSQTITDIWLEDFVKRRIVELQPPTRTWNNVKTIMRGMFKYGKKRGMTNISIEDFLNDLEVSKKNIRRPKRDSSSQVFTSDEIEKILEICEQDGSLSSLGIELAAYTGLRTGELVALKYSDFQDGHLIVQRTEIRYIGSDGHYEYGIQEFTKGRDGIRTVVLSQDALNVVRRLNGLRGESDYIFHGKMHSGAFTNRLYRICDKLGIQKRSLHKLRKTYATKLINANIPESIITGQMGHTDISTTRNHYYYDNYSLAEKETILAAI